MPECEKCGTIHGTQAYEHENDDEAVTYCVHCAPEDAEVIEDDYPVVEYPDQR